MFRACTFRLAPLASLKPILAVSVRSQASVRRMIGFRLQRLPNASAINSTIEKTKGDGLAGWSAIVSRCAMYLGGHNPTLAISELDEVIPKITDEPLRRHALGIRLRARNQLLDAKEASLSVSGGATEAEVSQLRTEAQKDYELLKASSTGCWLVQLGCAEYSLYTGSAELAYEELTQVEGHIKKFLAVPVNLEEGLASEANTYPHTLLGFHLQRVHNTQNVKADASNKLINEAITAIATEPEAAIALAKFKKELGGSLTDEEVLEVALTLHIANIRHHFMDYFKSNTEYDDWTSPLANHVKNLVRNAYHPTSTLIEEPILESVRKTTPPNAFYVPDEKLREVLKSAPKDKSVIESIRSALGSGPQTPLSKADEAYEAAVKGVLAAGASQDTAGTLYYARRQTEVCKSLAKQYLYRCQVQKAVALIQMHRAHEAVEVLSPVIHANEYIYMWRALLARSKAYKTLGLITNADKDHKVLEDLRKSLINHAPYVKC